MTTAARTSSLTLAFPFAASSRPTRPGKLGVAHDLADLEFEFGEFTLIVISGSAVHLLVYRRGASTPLAVPPFRTPAGRAFLAARRGTYSARGRGGHLRPVESIVECFRHQFLAEAAPTVLAGRPALRLRGHLAKEARDLEPSEPAMPAPDAVGYELRLVDVDGERLGIEVDLLPEPHDEREGRAEGEPAVGERLFTDLFWEQRPDAHVFGLGVQYSRLDMRGRAVPVLTAEQGVGRGAQPVTRYAEAYGGAGGDWWSTYAPVPGFLSTDLSGLLLTDTAPARFDFRRPGVGSVRVYAPSLHAIAYAAPTPSELIELHTRTTGRMQPLPDWAHAGVVLGVQGGSAKVERVVRDVILSGAPVAAVWLQDWVGNRRVPFGTRLWWDWQRDTHRYPDWHEMLSRLAARGVKVLTYVNPFLAPRQERPNGQPVMFDVAANAGYLVTDASGKPYLTDQGDFVAGLVDLSDQAAGEWYLETLATNLAESGACGWMADFGEGLPFDAHLKGGSAHEWHNRYPEAWAEFNAELRGRVADLTGRHPDQIVTFFRSGYTRSPGSAGLFWLGDQCVTWDRFDGLASALTGLLSSGFSGFSLQHGDVGGYTSTVAPLPTLVRTPELLARWGELMAFTVMLRSHEGNRPDENVQVYSTPATRNAFARAAELHASWRELRRALMAEAAATGMPVVRHPWLQYPSDPVCASLGSQFFLGPDLLVAPVLHEGADSVRAYLPARSGTWRHRYTGERYPSGPGSWVEVPAPLGQPGVFERLA